MPPKEPSTKVLVEGWKPPNQIADRRVKFDFWEESKNRRYPSVIYKPLLAPDSPEAVVVHPSEEERRRITPGKIFDFYFEDFITTVILKAAQAKYEAEMKKVTKPPTLEDIRRVILAVLIMIVSPQRWTKMYWAKSPMYQTPLMRKVISRDRFWALFPLVFSWDILEGEQYFNRKFKEVYSPSSYMVLDELMCKYKGRTKNKVYMPRKKIRTGIKIFSINDSTPEATYLWDFATYLKEDTRKYPRYLKPPGSQENRGSPASTVPRP